MRIAALAFGAAVVAASLGPSAAADPAHGFRLAEENGCFECHAIGWKLVGPAFTDIAARYRFDREARELLAGRLRFGGTQHWGERFNMWPQTNLSDEQAHVLVEWVLSQH